jgi:hypothetical protein
MSFKTYKTEHFEIVEGFKQSEDRCDRYITQHTKITIKDFEFAVSDPKISYGNTAQVTIDALLNAEILEEIKNLREVTALGWRIATQSHGFLDTGKMQRALSEEFNYRGTKGEESRKRRNEKVLAKLHETATSFVVDRQRELLVTDFRILLDAWIKAENQAYGESMTRSLTKASHEWSREHLGAGVVGALDAQDAAYLKLEEARAAYRVTCEVSRKKQNMAMLGWLAEDGWDINGAIVPESVRAKIAVILAESKGFGRDSVDIPDFDLD